jgi:3-oxo-5-alpha-steroid 4-dehydrogenase 3
MLAQSLRRLYESYAYAKPSTSSMWIGHWLMGLGFYFLINIAIWIEPVPGFDSPTIVRVQSAPLSWMLNLPWILTSLYVLYHMLRQNALHYYLSTLPPGPHYVLPIRDEFASTIAPHYGHEISIYWGIAVLGSFALPSPFILYMSINWTLAFASLFVCVNLWTTAKGTRDWYFRKWGPKAIKDKTMMITTSWFTTSLTSIA